MSVTKPGSRRPQLRLHEQRPAPPGHLPRRRGRHHGRRRGRQRPSQRAPRTSRPATTRSSPSRPSPTRTASPAASAATAATRGAATTRTTRSPTSATTAATSTSSRRANASCPPIPGRATRTCRGRRWRPRGHRRGRALQGEPPERDAGRGQGGAPLPGQPQLEDLDRPRPVHEPLLDVSRIGDARRRSTSARPPTAATDRRGRHDGLDPGHARPQRDVLRAGPAVDHVAARRLDGVRRPSSLMGWTANSGRLSVTIPAGTPLGRLPDRGPGARTRAEPDDGRSRRGRRGRPDRRSRRSPLVSERRGRDDVTPRVRVAWPAGHGSVERDRRLRGADPAANGGAWSAATAHRRAQAARSSSSARNEPYALPRPGASTRPATGARGSRAAAPTPSTPSTTAARRSAIRRVWTPTLERVRVRRGPTRASSSAGASLTMTFTGRGIAVVAPTSPQRGSARSTSTASYVTDDHACGRRPTADRQVVFTRTLRRRAARHTHHGPRRRQRDRTRCSGSTRSSSRSSRLANGASLARVRYGDRPDAPGRESPGRSAERRGLPWRERCGRGPSSSGWSPSRSSSISRPNPRASASTCSTRTTCRGSR